MTENRMAMSEYELLALGKTDLVDMVVTLRGDLLVAQSLNETLDADNKRKYVALERYKDQLDRLAKDNEHLAYRLGKAIEKHELGGLTHDA